jgi:hypothetical protein
MATTPEVKAALERVRNVLHTEALKLPKTETPDFYTSIADECESYAEVANEELAEE